MLVANRRTTISPAQERLLIDSHFGLMPKQFLGTSKSSSTRLLGQHWQSVLEIDGPVGRAEPDTVDIGARGKDGPAGTHQQDRSVNTRKASTEPSSAS